MKDLININFDFNENTEKGYFVFSYLGHTNEIRHNDIDELNSYEYNCALNEISSYFGKVIPNVIESEPKPLKSRTNVKSSTMGVSDCGVTDTMTSWSTVMLEDLESIFVQPGIGNTLVNCIKENKKEIAKLKQQGELR